MNTQGLYFIFLLVITCFACQQDEKIQPLHFPELMEVPGHFPEVEFPDNTSFTQDRWELGKRLFYEKAMSLDSTISCASCHKQELAFSDDVAMSLGVDGSLGTRNAPSLANVGYHPYFTREGGVPSLEMQVLVPIQEHNEFNTNIVILAERLASDSSYIRMADLAYDRIPDPYVIVYALACFERSLISGQSPYDHYINPAVQAEKMSDAAVKGMELFFSEKTNCSNCHGGFNFSNYAFENNGLYENYPDDGRFRLTGEESDRAKFKVPSLRNIALTAPYMHDGSITTLQEVIQHYISGGSMHPNKSESIQPLVLTNEEQSDLVHFLEALTDQSFIHNPQFKNE